VDLRLIETFVSVARTGSISAAATALHLTPSAVSRQIRRLEEQVGVELFERREGRPLEVSGAGQRLLETGEGLIAQAQAIDGELRSFAGGAQGRLTVGFPSLAMGAPEVVTLLRSFGQAHPAVDVSFTEHVHYQDVIGAIQRQEYDVAFTVMPPEARIPRVETLELLSVALHVALAPEHPLARRRALTPRELARQRIAAIDGSLGQEVYLNACARAGIDTRISHRCTQATTLTALAAANLAAAVVMINQAHLRTAPWQVRVAVRPVESPDPLVASLALVWASDRPLQSPAQAFMTHVRSVVAGKDAATTGSAAGKDAADAGGGSTTDPGESAVPAER
jgi:DNA-binding transcriptional LysR family regulator